MSEKLVEYELQVLRCVDGDYSEGLVVGAAYHEALVRLYRMGYLERQKHGSGWELGLLYTITDKGRAALKDMERT